MHACVMYEYAHACLCVWLCAYMYVRGGKRKTYMEEVLSTLESELKIFDVCELFKPTKEELH